MSIREKIHHVPHHSWLENIDEFPMNFDIGLLCAFEHKKRSCLRSSWSILLKNKTYCGLDLCWIWGFNIWIGIEKFQETKGKADSSLGLPVCSNELNHDFVPANGLCPQMGYPPNRIVY